MKKYIFNLDLPEEKRWLSILPEFKSKFVDLRVKIDSILQDFGIGGTTCAFVRYLMRRNQNRIMYLGELRSIAAATGIALEKIFLLQLCYEACTACTTVVTETKENEPIFWRFMDWDFEWLKQYTVQLVFTKNGRVIFEAPTWVGCVGVFTAYSQKQQVAAAINYRQTKIPSLFSLLTNVHRVWKLFWPASYLIRSCFENEANTDTLRSRLASARLVAPCYFTIFDAQSIGKSQVLTRGCDSKDVLVREYDIKRRMLVQTNCDDDKTSPNILWSVERRKKVCDLLRGPISREILQSGLLKHPILNHETVYYCIMDREQCETVVP